MQAERAAAAQQQQGGQALETIEPKAPSDDSSSPSYASVTQGSKKSKKNKSQHAAVEPSQMPATITHPESHNIPARPGFWSTMTGSLTGSRIFNRFSLLLNALLVLACLDMQFVPLLFYPQNDLAFMRMGAVSSTSATLVARVPPVHQLEAAEFGWDAELHAKTIDHGGAQVLYRLTQPLGEWNKGPVLSSTNESDWTVKAELTGLYASVRSNCLFLLGAEVGLLKDS